MLTIDCILSSFRGDVFQVLCEESETVGAAAYQSDVTDRLQLLAETSTAVQLLIKARFFNCWKNRFAGQSSFVLPSCVFWCLLL